MKNESPKIKFLKKGNRIELHADGHRSCIMNIVTRKMWGATEHMGKLLNHVNEKYTKTVYNYFLVDKGGTCIDKTQLDERNKKLAEQIFTENGRKPLPDGCTIECEKSNEKN